MTTPDHLGAAPHSPKPEIRKRARGVPALVAVLILVGVAAGVGRLAYIDSLALRVEPIRTELLERTGVTDRHAASRPEIIRRFDARYDEHRAATYLHVGLGALFLLVAPLQFSERLRARRPDVHRWTGRALVTGATLIVLSGLFFGVLIPSAGPAERLVVSLFSGFVLFAFAAALWSIRRGAIAAHRRWMVRAFAVMLGISSVRLVAAVLDPALTYLGFGTETVFVASLWLGWAGTLGAAEFWLRRTASQRALRLSSSRT